MYFVYLTTLYKNTGRVNTLNELIFQILLESYFENTYYLSKSTDYVVGNCG